MIFELQVLNEDYIFPVHFSVPPCKYPLGPWPRRGGETSRRDLLIRSRGGLSVSSCPAANLGLKMKVQTWDADPSMRLLS